MIRYGQAGLRLIRKPGFRASLMASVALVGLNGCASWESVMEMVFGKSSGPMPQVATERSSWASEFGTTGPVLEPGESLPATWVAADPAAGGHEAPPPSELADGSDVDAWAGMEAAESDDILAEIAAAVSEDDEEAPVQVASVDELDELRGGFITRLGPISVGFDVKTFVNGVLQVRNIFNVVGTIPTNTDDTETTDTTTSTVVSVSQGASGSLGQTVVETVTGGGNTPPANNSTPPATNTNTTPPATNTNTTPPTTPNPTPPTVDTTPAPEPVTTVVNNVGNNAVTVVNQLNGGETTVVNQVENGAVNTTVINNASGLSIDQVTNVVIGIADPSNIVGQIRSGINTNAQRSIRNGMRDALIGAVSR